MSTPRASHRLLFGWFIIAVSLMGQAPRLYSQDPSCPTCQGKGRPQGPLVPVPQGPQEFAPQGPALEAPPAESPVQHEGPVQIPTAAPVQGIPVQGPGPIAAPVLTGPVEMDDCPIPCVRLKIRAPACAEVGKEFEYRIKVENTTPTDAHNVIVRMALPASVKILRASPQVHQREPELQWNFGTVPGWGSHDIVVQIVPVGLADIKNCTRVTFEHGQCVTTKVIMTAPDGSADGRGGIPGMDGRPGGGFPGGPGGGPGGIGARPDFDVKIFGPAEAPGGQDVTYKVSLFNKGDQPVSSALVGIQWSNELQFIRANADFVRENPNRNELAWPKGIFEKLMPGESRSIDMIFRAPAEGRGCLMAKASANSAQNKIVEAKDELCTIFRRGIPGMTLEMFDRDDPILKNGTTSYPITVRNQGSAPIKNLRVKARVPDLLTMTDVRSSVKYRPEMTDGRGFWVEFEPLTLNVGETQNYEIFVKGKGREGEARFHVEMTADELDKGANGATRWIVEEESTTLVPDEEMRERIRQISRKGRDRLAPATVTSQPSASGK